MAASPQALGAALANPYASGISVAGTGPNNSATNWGVTWDPATGTYAANTGFGMAPIYNASQFASLVPNTQTGAIKGLGNESFALSAPAGATTNPFDPGTYVDPVTGQIAFQTAAAGNTLGINTGGTGQQDIVYKLDPATGYYIPASASGTSGGTSLVDNLIKYGAIAGGAVAAGAGAMGYGSAGPGASAVGGSADVPGAASGLGDVAQSFPIAAQAPAQTSQLAPLSGYGGSGGMAFDPSSLVQGAADSANTSVGPQLAADQSAIAGQGMAGITADAANLGTAGLSTMDKIKLAQNLLKFGQQVTGGGATGQGTQPMRFSGQQLAGGLSGNLKMMIEANAQAQMNGQPAPFPGLGGQRG